MSLTNDFQSLGDKLVKDCEDRRKYREELRYYVQDYLGQVAARREEVARDMWDRLHEARSNRTKEVSRLLDEISRDREQAGKSWEKTLQALNKIRSN
ncbi:MAG: hypothetical protein WCY82_02850 [Desulfotomaculaceae bacterium]